MPKPGDWATIAQHKTSHLTDNQRDWLFTRLPIQSDAGIGDLEEFLATVWVPETVRPQDLPSLPAAFGHWLDFGRPRR